MVVEGLILIAAIVGTILLFGLSIFVHELGHFLVARRNGMKVERFSIGFGKTLWKKTVDGVEYRVGLIPAGGYVMLPQMEPIPLEGSSSTEEDQEPLPPAHPWVKIKVAFAGAFFNLLFVLFLTTLVWGLGRPVEKSDLSTRIGFIAPESPAAKSELRLGDTILEVAGRPVKDYEELSTVIALSPVGEIELKVLRGEQTLAVSVFLENDKDLKLPVLGVSGAGVPIVERVSPGDPAEAAGVQAGDHILEVNGTAIFSRRQVQSLIREWGTDQPLELVLDRKGERVVVEVVPVMSTEFKIPVIGIQFTEQMISTHPTPIAQIKSFLIQMRDTLGALFSKKSEVGVKDLSGPIGIFSALQRMLVVDFRIALWFTAFLNLNLAILNLLPFPVLDGGHILFSTYELIMRRPIHPKLIYALHTVFTVLLITLFLVVTFHDIRRTKEMHSNNRSSSESEEPGEAPADGVQPAAEPVTP